MTDFRAEQLLLQSHSDQLTTECRQLLEALGDHGRDLLYDAICDMHQDHDDTTQAIGMLAHLAFISTVLHVADMLVDEDSD